jgi:ABC-type multidrug transport system ATPase subunit
MTDFLFHLLGAEKRYGARTVLRIEEFVLAPKDCVLVLGENGSGKSTLFRVLAGISKLSRGQIRRSASGEALRIGFLPQAGGVYEDMTLRQNVSIYCNLYGAPTVDRIEEHWFVKDTALASLVDVPVATLSGGTKRLATLACIFSAMPNALLLDEPTSELDSIHSRHVYEGLERLIGGLELLMLSTHDERAYPFVTRTVTMKGGRIS